MGSNQIYKTNCRFFSGYKPCIKKSDCTNCNYEEPIEQRVVIIHLGALGAVVRSTSLLRSLRKKHPQSHITWVTDKPADRILKGHPDVDWVVTRDNADLIKLQMFNYEAVYIIDKSIDAVAVGFQLKTKKRFGFSFDPKSGGIIPATPAAHELWTLGLDDNKKFFQNKKSEVKLQAEALELAGFDDLEYNLPLDANETKASLKRAQSFRLNSKQPVIGLNTGCAQTIPHKKFTIDFQRQLIQELLHLGYENIVLLGGPEDTERNEAIAKDFQVLKSPTMNGLRDGLVSVAACDIIISGDSLGMHMAISQQKFVIAWFGPTVAEEIELYGRGVALRASVSCSPCWKRVCNQQVMCYDRVELGQIIQAIKLGEERWKESTISFCRQPFSAT